MRHPDDKKTREICEMDLAGPVPPKPMDGRTVTKKRMEEMARLLLAAGNSPFKAGNPNVFIEVWVDKHRLGVKVDANYMRVLELTRGGLLARCKLFGIAP